MPGLVKRLGNKLIGKSQGPVWSAEPEHDDTWARFKPRGKRQDKGPIRAALRNKQQPVDANHQNRAGHRTFVRTMQTRQVRKNIVGFGKWRKHIESTEPSYAALTAPKTFRSLRLDRRTTRRSTIETASAFRKARGRRITPVK